MIKMQERIIIGDGSFEDATKFKYLGMTPTNQKYLQRY
jgi:hypothetical protein